MSSFRKDMLVSLVDRVWSLSEPGNFIEARKQKFTNELEANIKFILVPRMNDLPEEDKINLFGKTNIERKDISFEWLNNVLMPVEDDDAVRRYDSKINGSRHNYEFTAQQGRYDRDRVFSPSTITIYPDQKKDNLANLVVNTLLDGSGAKIISEDIYDFTHHIWLLREDVKYNIHNALELIEKHLWNTTVKDEDKDAIKNKIIEDVEKRLPQGEKVCFEEGVTVRSLLANRPGVKMYLHELDENGKLVNVEEDVKKLDLINHQNLPKLLSELPTIPGYSKSGKMHKNESKFFNLFRNILGESRLEAFSDTFRSALGDKTYEMAFNWNFGHLKNLLQEEGIGSNKSLLANGRAIAGFIGYLPDILVGTAAVIFYGTSYITCSAAAKTFEVLSGVKDPVKNMLIPYVEKKTGYSFTNVTVHDNWVARETKYLGEYAADISTFFVKPNPELSATPSTRMVLETPAFYAKVSDVKKLDVKDFTKAFMNRCSTSEAIVSATPKIKDMDKHLKNYATGFAESLNGSIKNGYAHGGTKFKDSVINLFQNTNAIKTKELVNLEDEIMKLIRDTFAEQQSKCKKDISIDFGK